MRQVEQFHAVGAAALEAADVVGTVSFRAALGRRQQTLVDVVQTLSARHARQTGGAALRPRAERARVVAVTVELTAVAPRVKRARCNARRHTVCVYL